MFLSALTIAFADTVDVREWLVPWPDSAPTTPVVDVGGRIWFVGSEDDYVANFSPDTAEFNRYDLRKGTEPVHLLVNANRELWFASHRRRMIGRLDPSTGRVTEFDMPNRKAKELRSMTFDRDGNIWFTAEGGDMVGRLRVDSGDIDLIELPGGRSRPFGIAINRYNEAWVAGPDSASLYLVDPVDLTAVDVPLPNEDASPHRIAITSDDLVWYTDTASGTLGRYNPAIGEFVEWTMPGGPESRPLALAVDRYDRLWIIETGRVPNRLIGFDARLTNFLTVTDIPSGAGSIGDLYYHEPAGEIWFGTATNYVGRAVIH
jgi:virginiamycin B lyase